MSSKLISSKFLIKILFIVGMMDDDAKEEEETVLEDEFLFNELRIPNIVN